MKKLTSPWKGLKRYSQGQSQGHDKKLIGFPRTFFPAGLIHRKNIFNFQMTPYKLLRLSDMKFLLLSISAINIMSFPISY